MRAAAQELIAVRRKLAALAPCGERTRPQAGAGRKPLEAKEEALVKKLGLAVRGDRSGSYWVDLDEVRRKIPEKGVLIEFAHFNVRAVDSSERPAPWGPAHYAAWIIPPAGQGQVRVADLGSAQEIEEIVALVREKLIAAPQRIEQLGEADAENEVREALEKLSRNHRAIG